MDIKQISATQHTTTQGSPRPTSFSSFIGQEDTKKVIQAAITSAHSSNSALGHILFSGESGYGKTTLSQIIAHEMWAHIKIITGYALSKPSDMVSLLNTLQTNDILFIDEIHRLKPSVEEVLYIAMEDYRIDMIMPDGWSLSVPLQPFTLVGATTKLEKLSTPLKNRFVYKFHFNEYTKKEQQLIISRYLDVQNITTTWETLLDHMAQYIPNVPREIATTCIQIKDFLIAHHDNLSLDQQRRDTFQQRRNIEKWWITTLHQKYLTILDQANMQPVGLKTLAVKLWMSEQSVEDDIEPLLFKLGKIEKTMRGRILL